MGAKFSPSWANLYMVWWERRHIYGTDNPYSPFIKTFFRYIDDLIFIMDVGFGSLDDSFKYLNHNNMNLQFTGHCDRNEINFLDVHLCGRDMSIHTSLYRKPISGNTLLAKSGHPRHTIRGIPVIQFLRIRKI